jgi:putative resolvase
MKLSEWARLNGMDAHTASKLFYAGDIPGARRLSTGTILIDQSLTGSGERVGYARVSSGDQKADLERQADRLRMAGCTSVVTETGSGLNGARPKLKKLLAGKADIVVVHRERLARFGVEYIEACLESQGRKVIVLDPSELSNDLAQDMIDVLTSFCARLYGQRSAKNRALRIAQCVNSDMPE